MLKSRGGREENEKLLLSVKDFTVRIGRRTLVHKKKFEKWLEKQET